VDNIKDLEDVDYSCTDTLGNFVGCGVCDKRWDQYWNRYLKRIGFETMKNFEDDLEYMCENLNRVEGYEPRK